MSEKLKAFITVFKLTKVYFYGARPELSITINECNNWVIKRQIIEVLPGV